MTTIGSRLRVFAEAQYGSVAASERSKNGEELGADFPAIARNGDAAR